MTLQALKLAISQSMELFSARKTAVCRSQWVIPFTTWSCPWAARGSKDSTVQSIYTLVAYGVENGFLMVSYVRKVLVLAQD